MSQCKKRCRNKGSPVEKKDEENRKKEDGIEWTGDLEVEDLLSEATF
jgi:hypothetical protein